MVEAVRALEGQDNSCSTARLSFRQGEAFSFDALLQRIHPAASRVQSSQGNAGAADRLRSAGRTPTARALTDEPLTSGAASGWKRLPASIFAKGGAHPAIAGDHEARATPKWLKRVGATLDGIIAKRRDLPYRSGDRTACRRSRTTARADCVVGGFRYNEGKPVVGSLLLGLYDEEGLLHHVGFTSTISERGKPR